jgi:hypothetical protein
MPWFSRPAAIEPLGVRLAFAQVARELGWVRVDSVSTKDGCGANGHVAGLKAVDDVVAQLRFRHVQVASQRTLDIGVARRGPDVQVALRNVQPAPVKANVDDLHALFTLDHDRVPRNHCPLRQPRQSTSKYGPFIEERGR